MIDNWALRTARSRAKYDALLEALDRFNAWWPSRLVIGRAWQIAFRDRHEHLSIIPVTPVPDAQLVDTVSDALTQFGYQQGQDVNETLRLPGAIVLSESPCQHLRRINRLKSELKVLARAIARPHRTRFNKAVYDIGDSPLQVTRLIPGLAYAPRDIRFTWAGRTHASRVLSDDDAKARLRQDARERWPQLDTNAREAKIAAALALIDNRDPRQVVKFHQPVAPHPRIQVTQHNDDPLLHPAVASGQRKWSHIFHASLPLFVPCAPTKRTPRIATLRDFSGPANPRPRKSRLVAQIDRGSHLYLATPSQRR
jgi:hypothetical protein